MTVRDMLVVLDEDVTSQRRALQAAKLAVRLKAHLTGVFLRPALPQPGFAVAGGAWMPPVLLQDTIETHQVLTDRASESARVYLEAAATSEGVAADWRVLDADLAEGLIQCARRTDLAIVPRHRMPSWGEFHISAATLTLACGGPVIVAPESSPDALGVRILVAWDGSREAARALRDARPLIATADEVQVVIVSETPDRLVEGLPKSLAARKVEVVTETADPALAGDILRREVRNWRADLLVMGLYGRPRLAELALGGVSREFLAEPPCALFVSH